jgi:membrane-associated phospholipid phosphatase
MEVGLPTSVAERLSARQRYGARAALFALAVVLVTVPFGLLLEQVTDHGELVRWDSALARWLNSRVHHRPVVVDALQVVSFLGQPIFLALVIGGPVIWLARRRRWHLAAYLLVTSLVGGTVDSAVKVLVGRPRPVVEDPVATARGMSFPSGHSMSSTVCYGALLLVFAPLLNRRHRMTALAATVALVLAIGFSRLALGVHFLTDVVGGYVLGGAWLVASTAAFEIWRDERGLHPTTALVEGVEPEEVVDLLDGDPGPGGPGSDAENHPVGSGG